MQPASAGFRCSSGGLQPPGEAGCADHGGRLPLFFGGLRRFLVGVPHRSSAVAALQ
ncbi:MAG TPA: hypothetical protein VE913_23070 [Longimicrobium sp.]|nr:hypothetical protein [Longimicrobium sp.]